MKLDIYLPENDALRLLCAFKQGKLADLHVADVTLIHTERHGLGTAELPNLWMTIKETDFPVEEKHTPKKKHKRA